LAGHRADPITAPGGTGHILKTGESAMTLEMVNGVLRAVIAAAGGYFVGKGVLTADQLAAISGAAMSVAAAAWSIWAKTTAPK
jgi:hypothetical protein